MYPPLSMEQYLAELRYLVNLDSHSSDPEGVRRIAAFFSDGFRKAGWSVDEVSLGPDAGPCLAATNGLPPYDCLILGHMDTVFPKGTASERPFRTDGVRAWGPGVSDMKAGLLFGLFAARAIGEHSDHGSLCFAWNSEEEIGSIRARPWIEELARKSRTVLVLEPARASGNLVNQRKGIGRISATFHGKAAHAGVEPEKGISALNEMGHWITELHDLTDVNRGTTINVGTASGGTGINVVAEKASMEVDIRFTRPEETRRLEEALERLRASPVTPGIRVVSSFIVTRPPMNPSPATKALCALVEDAGRAAGVPVGWQATGGGSDGNFTAALGIPTVDAMGPRGGAAHSMEEYLELSDLPQRFALFMEVLGRLPGAAFPHAGENEGRES